VPPLLIGQVLDALLGLEVELNPESLVLGIDEDEGVASEAVHVPIGGGNAPVTHNNGYLVECLRQRGPEVPVVEGATQICAGVSLHFVVQIRKLKWIAQEENRGVIPHEVPVALLSIEFHCKTTYIPLSIGSTTFAGYGRKAQKAFGLFPFFGEDLGLGVLGDVVGNGEGAKGA
jgi:hypothetical protein